MESARLPAFMLMLALTAGAGASRAEERTPLPTEPFDLTGAVTYSDLCLNAETSNPYGLRVFLLPPGRAPQVAAQRAAGLMAPPVAGKLVSRGGRRTFAIDGPDPRAAFRGEIIGDEAVLRSLADPRILRLPRRDDTQGLPNCR